LKVLLLAVLSAGAQLHEEAHEASVGLISPGGMVIYYDSTGTNSMVSMTARELPPDARPMGEVSGQACQYGLSLPFFLSSLPLAAVRGRGGYEDALRDLTAAHPWVRGLYDVRVDLRTTRVLGFFARLCTEVKGLGYR
jgi:hypothetical protein